MLIKSLCSQWDGGWAGLAHGSSEKALETRGCTAHPMSKVASGGVPYQAARMLGVRAQPGMVRCQGSRPGPALILKGVYGRSRHGQLSGTFWRGPMGWTEDTRRHWLFALRAPTGLWSVSQSAFPNPAKRWNIPGKCPFSSLALHSPIHVRAGVRNSRLYLRKPWPLPPDIRDLPWATPRG